MYWGPVISSSNRKLKVITFSFLSCTAQIIKISAGLKTNSQIFYSRIRLSTKMYALGDKLLWREWNGQAVAQENGQQEHKKIK